MNTTSAFHPPQCRPLLISKKSARCFVFIQCVRFDISKRLNQTRLQVQAAALKDNYQGVQFTKKQPFRQILNWYGLDIKEVVQDNQSLYRAIADQMRGDEDYYEAYQNHLIALSLQNEDAFRRYYCTQNLAILKSELHQAGQKELNLIARCILEVNFRVFVLDQDYQPIQVRESLVEISSHNKQQNKQDHMINLICQNGHYKSLRPRIEYQTRRQNFELIQQRASQVRYKIFSKYSENTGYYRFSLPYENQLSSTMFQQQTIKNGSSKMNQGEEINSREQTKGEEKASMLDIVTGEPQIPTNKLEINQNWQQETNSVNYNTQQQYENFQNSNKNRSRKVQKDERFYGNTDNQSAKQANDSVKLDSNRRIPTSAYTQVVKNENNLIHSGGFRYLSKYNLKIVSISGDGNCYFRAVGDQLGMQDCHYMIRQSVMTYVEQNQERFGKYMSGQSLRKYVQKKRKSGVWADEIEIVATMLLFKVKICIFEAGEQITQYAEEDYEHTIYLTYSGSHYNSVRHVADRNPSGQPIPMGINVVKIWKVFPMENMNYSTITAVQQAKVKNVEKIIKNTRYQMKKYAQLSIQGEEEAVKNEKQKTAENSEDLQEIRQLVMLRREKEELEQQKRINLQMQQACQSQNFLQDMSEEVVQSVIKGIIRIMGQHKD